MLSDVQDRGMDASWTTFMSMTGSSSARQGLGEPSVHERMFQKMCVIFGWPDQGAPSSSGQMAESERKPVKVSRMRRPYALVELGFCFKFHNRVLAQRRTPLSSKATPFRSKTAGYLGMVGFTRSDATCFHLNMCRYCATMKAGFADSMTYPYSPESLDCSGLV